MTNDTIGVDISKDHLDAHRMNDGASRRFTNGKAGHKAFVGWLGEVDARIVYEPTGPYHRAFERRLAEAGLALVKVNPRQARRFAEATGRLAKTDRLDAAMLARMGALLDLEARPARSALLNDLKDLHMAREALMKNRTAAKNRAKYLTLAILRRQNAEQLRQIERQMAAIEAEIMALIKIDPDLASRFDILVSIPGVSAITAFALIIDMPELGTLENGQAASLAGLAPVARQSGNWTGRAFIRGGRANLRQALYMPALVAMRFNPDLKAKYDQLIAAGKASKVAITAIMRKLVVLANALIRDGRNWTPSLPGPKRILVFSARTGMFAGDLVLPEITDYISGVVIGSEFREAQEQGWFEQDGTIGIVGNDGLNERHARAASSFGISVLDSDDRAAICGALAILDAVQEESSNAA